MNKAKIKHGLDIKEKFSKKFVLACILEKETFDYFDKKTDVTSEYLPIDDFALADYIIKGKITIHDTECKYHNKREFISNRDKLCKKYNTQRICGVEVENVWEFIYSITNTVGSNIIYQHLDTEAAIENRAKDIGNINNIISFINKFTPGILPDNKSDEGCGV